MDPDVHVMQQVNAQCTMHLENIYICILRTRYTTTEKWRNSLPKYVTVHVYIHTYTNKHKHTHTYIQ